MVTSAALRRLEAAPRRRQVRRLRRDRHRQPHQERHPVERGPLLARRRHRPSEPLASSRAAARSSTASSCSADPTRTCRSSRSAGACGSRRRGTSAATRTRRTCRSRRSSSSPRTPVLRGARRRALRPARGSARRHLLGARRPRRVHDQRPQGAPRRDAPARRCRRRKHELAEFSELYRIPKFVPEPFERGAGRARGHRPGRRVNVEQGRARRFDDGKILCKAYQLSKGNPIQDTKELLAQLREYVEVDQKAKLEVMGFGATGYAADVLQECVRADVNIVETVAHMMSAVHFFGDVDVICDIGGQDIKVLFMKNGDIANFRLSNSCSAGNGMLLQATADSFGVPVTEFADVAFKAELAPKFSLRLRRLPRHRPRELPEGGLLQGGDARRSRAGPAEERLAVRRADPAHGGARARSSCSRAARSTTSPPSRRRSTTSRSACRARRSSCTRTRARPARSAPRWRRCAS